MRANRKDRRSPSQASFEILTCAVLNWRVLVSPGVLIPVSVLLYFLSCFVNRTQRRLQAGRLTRVARPD
jgi:hypothetical protein